MLLMPVPLPSFLFQLFDVHMCSRLRALPVYPQFHAIWHFFVGLSTYSGLGTWPCGACLLVCTMLIRPPPIHDPRAPRPKRTLSSVITIVARRVTQTAKLRLETATAQDTAGEAPVHQLTAPAPRTGDVVINMCGVPVSTQYPYVEGPLGVL